MKTLTESVDTFLDGADWLTEAEEPMVTTLRLLAATIDDNGISAALGTSFGVTYRSLLKRSPEAATKSEAEEFLDSL